MTEYQGYSLFDDIEDDDLRVRNQSVVMANIVELSSKGSKMSPAGTALLMGYFSELPLKDKKESRSLLEKELVRRGLIKEAA